jgi:hypothetical protein
VDSGSLDYARDKLDSNDRPRNRKDQGLESDEVVAVPVNRLL